MTKVVFGVFAQHTCPALYRIYLFISTTVVSSKQHMQITMYCIFVLYVDLYYKNEVLNHSQVRMTLKYISLHFINWKYICSIRERKYAFNFTPFVSPNYNF